MPRFRKITDEQIEEIARDIVVGKKHLTFRDGEVIINTTTNEETETMHPSTQAIMVFFEYEHLPEHLQEVSKPFSILAAIVASGPSNDETRVALRKLLEAKDAAVRASL